MMSLGSFQSTTRRALGHKGAAGQRLAVLGRAALMVGLELLKVTRSYPVKFGPHSFRFRFLPLGAGMGTRGIFLYRERYEGLLEHGWRVLNAGDNVIDCGANQGIYSCAFSAAVGTNGRVIAVEPLPWQPTVIQENLDLNRFKHCEIIEAAASDTNGTATLTVGDRDVSASLLPGKGTRSIEVKTRTLDSIVDEAGLTTLALVKLDIEGAELRALKGATRVLTELRPALCCEISPGEGAELADYLAGFGYRPHLLDADGFHPLTELRAHPGVFFLPTEERQTNDD